MNDAMNTMQAIDALFATQRPTNPVDAAFDAIRRTLPQVDWKARYEQLKREHDEWKHTSGWEKAGEYKAANEVLRGEIAALRMENNMLRDEIAKLREKNANQSHNIGLLLEQVENIETPGETISGTLDTETTQHLPDFRSVTLTTFNEHGDIGLTFCNKGAVRRIGLSIEAAGALFDLLGEVVE